MFQTNLSDRLYETTELLRRCKGVFSKTPRTLTSPPQFRITRLCGPEGFSTTALSERIMPGKHSGTDTSAHNCKNCNPDGSYAFLPDWNPFPSTYKGTVSCKRRNSTKHFPPDGAICLCPVTQYISDRRPCGVTRQQPDSAEQFFETDNGTSLLRFLNGSAGYRTYSEDSLMSPGWFYCIQPINVQKMNTKTTAVIPDICLER